MRVALLKATIASCLACTRYGFGVNNRNEWSEPSYEAPIQRALLTTGQLYGIMAQGSHTDHEEISTEAQPDAAADWPVGERANLHRNEP